MIYKGINIESFQLVSYLGEDRKHNTRQENQKYFLGKIEEISFSCSIECPIDDMICIRHDDITGGNLTELERKELIKCLKELKEIFPKSFINIYLDGFTEDGNCFDITSEEFEKLCLQQL